MTLLLALVLPAQAADDRSVELFRVACRAGDREKAMLLLGDWADELAASEVTPLDVALYLRARGAVEGCTSNKPAMVSWFLQAHLVAPRLGWSTELGPETGFVGQAWTAAATAPADPTGLLTSEGWQDGYRLVVDGTPGDAPPRDLIPGERLIQVYAAEERIYAQWLLIPSAGRQSLALGRPVNRHASKWLAVAGGASLATAGGLLALAADAKHDYTAGEFDDPALYYRNQVLGYSGYAATAAGAGLGVTALLVHRW